MERERHINNDHTVTSCMLCTIPHIQENVLNYPNGNNRKQVNTVIKTLFSDLSDDVARDDLDTVWSEYNHFNNNNDTFDSDEFIWSSKDICGANSHLWYQKYSLPCTKVLGF